MFCRLQAIFIIADVGGFFGNPVSDIEPALQKWFQSSTHRLLSDVGGRDNGSRNPSDDVPCWSEEFSAQNCQVSNDRKYLRLWNRVFAKIIPDKLFRSTLCWKNHQKNITTAESVPLLSNMCIHFYIMIVQERWVILDNHDRKLHKRGVYSLLV